MACITIEECDCGLARAADCREVRQIFQLSAADACPYTLTGCGLQYDTYDTLSLSVCIYAA